jgi:hypothetical protein
MLCSYEFKSIMIAETLISRLIIFGLYWERNVGLKVGFKLNFQSLHNLLDTLSTRFLPSREKFPTLTIAFASNASLKIVGPTFALSFLIVSWSKIASVIVIFFEVLFCRLYLENTLADSGGYEMSLQSIILRCCSLFDQLVDAELRLHLDARTND